MPNWGLPYDDSTYATFTRINDGLWLMIERGELTTQQLFQFRWNRIFDALGIRADGAAFEQRFWTFSMKRPSPSTARRRSCAISKDKYILCAASNAFTTNSSTGEIAGFSPL